MWCKLIIYNNLYTLELEFYNEKRFNIQSRVWVIKIEIHGKFSIQYAVLDIRCTLYMYYVCMTHDAIYYSRILILIDSPVRRWRKRKISIQDAHYSPIFTCVFYTFMLLPFKIWCSMTLSTFAIFWQSTTTNNKQQTATHFTCLILTKFYLLYSIQ